MGAHPEFDKGNTRSGCYAEGTIAFSTEAEHGEISVERHGLLDAETQHHGETGAIHDRELLIVELLANFARDMQICVGDECDMCHTAHESFPKAFGRSPSDAVAQQ